MSSLAPLRPRRIPALAGLLLFALVLTGTAAVEPGNAAEAPALAPHAAPAPASRTDDPDELRREVLEHRRQEAEAKTRLQAGLDEAWRFRTANQDDYDVIHYELNLDVDPSSNTLSGTVTTTAVVVDVSLSTMELDFSTGMTVSAATSGGAAASFSHSSNLVTVTLDQTYATGDTVVVGVTYSGDPAGASFGWSAFDSQDMIWTLSEPYGARAWWPCKDLNKDKADSVDIIVTVPDNLIVASQGLLLSDVDNGTTRTFHWSTGYPTATYLVSLAIHPYTQYSDWYTPQGGGSPMEVQFFVYPSHYPLVQTNYALTVPMIDAFAQAYGEYPFLDEKYGHAEFTWGGGMEHQTISSMGGYSEDLISHELAHQWFGDMITCKTFHHIWLNEGFATWSEAYWKETTEGVDTYRQYMDFAAYYGPGTVYVESPTFDDIFDVNLTYNKASWVVHMLRGVMGDTDFFQGLANYRSLRGYNFATTGQFRSIMQAASGLDLVPFFNQWVYGDYYPVYEFSWAPSAGGGAIDLTIEQVQTNGGLFTMPIQIRVETDQGTQDLVVQNSLALENYQLPVTGTVQSVSLDPDRWILREVKSTVTSPNFASGILLVNGVDWDTYPELTGAYADSAFWGDNPITFWDNFPAPAGGYPANLPTPLGHGAVPADVIGDYSAVVWVGNDYNGDLADWKETPIASYLEVGGNLLLMTRRAANFVDTELSTYLGINWTNQGLSLGNCTAVAPGLINIGFTGSQNLNDVFSTTVGSNSTLLFQDTSGSNRGTGVHSQPPGGGTYRTDGGQFVVLSGRPYRMDHAALRTNVEYILDNMFGEPYSSPSSVTTAATAERLWLRVHPNPSSAQTSIPFSLPRTGRAEVAIFDVTGRLVRKLVDESRPAGEQSVRWDGRDGNGRAVASGVYLVRLRTEDRALSKPLVRLR